VKLTKRKDNSKSRLNTNKNLPKNKPEQRNRNLIQVYKNYRSIMKMKLSTKCSRIKKRCKIIHQRKRKRLIEDVKLTSQKEQMKLIRKRRKRSLLLVNHNLQLQPNNKHKLQNQSQLLKLPSYLRPNQLQLLHNQQKHHNKPHQHLSFYQLI